jgi:O-acetyl-ADP-ribose deacetylase (regulator of RNase III)
MITYIKGDATCPLGAGVKIIAHVVNDRAGWGRGFVVAISKRWREPEEAYRRWAKDKNFILGEVQFVPVGKYLYVANMLCQHGLVGRSNPVPLRYPSLETCLKKVAQTAERLKASVHMPRIGCGLAGGKWEKIEPIIINTLESKNISVTVYDFG